MNVMPEWNIKLVGDGILKESLISMARSNNLKRIEFLNFQDSIPLIDESAILCLTSNIEGLPTTFIEAMSLGVVPIGFDSFSTIYEMIDNWENGVIIPAFDLKKYAEALIKLMTDNDLRYQMALSAQSKVKQYDVSLVADKWINLFVSDNILIDK